MTTWNTEKENRMKLAFVPSVSVKTATGDATEWHKALPRPMRKALRVATQRTKPAVHDGVDDYFRTGYKVDTYHTQNLEYLDRGYDFDEFGDIDNELQGLTIIEPLNEVELFQFCTGYDII
jgi:hypothetical protein